MSRMEYRSVPLQGVITDTDSRSHRIRAVFPVDTVDAMSTTFGPSCWTESFKRRLPAFLWMHKTDEPLGRCVSAQQLPDRSEVVARFSDVTRVPAAAKAFALVEDRCVDGVSFGFVDGVHRKHPDPRLGRRGVREYVKGTMKEVSLVTFPAIPGARVVDVRGLGYGYGPVDLDVLDALAMLDDIDAKAAHAAGLARLRRGERYDRQDAEDDAEMAALVAQARLEMLPTRKLARR